MYVNKFNHDEQSGYYALANAVIKKACDDYEKWQSFIIRNPSKTIPQNIKNHGESALRFLKSADLIMYTNIESEYILSHLDLKIKEKLQKEKKGKAKNERN